MGCLVCISFLEFQKHYSKLHSRFIEQFPLTPAEKSVLSRGRNANLSARKKMKGMSNSGAGPTDFQDSTAFEALLGFTYINDKLRFVEMIDAIKSELDMMDNE
jgi:23S rRNA maturation mini-RNase III